MRNILPTVAKLISTLAAKMIAGINSVGASVPVTMVTAAQMTAAKTAFDNSETDFQTKRQALQDANDAFAPANAAVLDFLNAARPIFVSAFGYSWSASWAAVGWTSHSTAIPTMIDKRIALVNSIATYLTDNPQYEMEETGVTAANATSTGGNAVELQGDVMLAERALRVSGSVRSPARRTLLGLMGDLISNLNRKLPKDDPRWLVFGLNMPATKGTPPQPIGLAAQIDAESGGIMLSCDTTPGTERWRWRGREAGSEMPFDLLKSTTEPMAVTKPFAGGTELELMVQAVNGGSQSVPSGSIIFTVPTPPTADALLESTAKLAAIKPAVSANGNGHGNGNGTAKNGRRSVSRVS